MVVVPCCLLCVAGLLGVLALQSQRCSYRRANKQDPEEPLEDLVMSPDKCLKELIYDMSTSGSGSGRWTESTGGPSRQVDRVDR